MSDVEFLYNRFKDIPGFICGDCECDGVLIIIHMECVDFRVLIMKSNFKTAQVKNVWLTIHIQQKHIGMLNMKKIMMVVN